MNQPAVFAGCRAELYLLAQCLHQARRGEPQVVLIEGEPGIGKTALLRAFAATREPRDERLRLLFLQPPGVAEYDPVPQAALGLTAKRLYDRVGGRREAKDLLLEWMGVIPGWGDLVAAVSATADALRRRRGEGRVEDEDVEALLAAARRPLVLLFDDLHQAEREAIARLEVLIRALGKRRRLLLVGVYRPAVRGAEDPPIRQLVAALPPGSVRHRKLRALIPKEINLWLDKQFPRAVRDAAFLDWLLEATGGHPATIERTLAHLLARSAIRFVDRHWEVEADRSLLERPQTESISVDLSGIRPEVAAIVQSASVLGEEFDGSALAQLLDQDELYVEDQLALAVHHGLLQIIGEATLPDGDIATLYRFTTPYLRSALYHTLSAERRAALEQQRAQIPTS